MTNHHCPEVNLCGWQDVKLQLLTYSQKKFCMMVLFYAWNHDLALDTKK